MVLFRNEFYKLRTRKTVSMGIILLFLLFFLYFWMNVLSSEVVISGGEKYTRSEAIAKDREIAAGYAGKMTMEKAEEILDAYGYVPLARSGNVLGDPQNYNFTSRFVIENLTDWRWNSQGDIHLLSPEDAQYELAENWLESGVTYGYVKGFDDFTETFAVFLIGLNVLLIAAFAPVFSEEYALHTAQLLLTTKEGKRKDIGAKLIASMSYGTLLYVVFAAVILGCFLMTYGTDGLSASAGTLSSINQISNAPVYFQENGMTVRIFLIRFLLWGLASVWLNAAVCLLVSAASRQTFGAVICCLLVFFIPRLVDQLVLSRLSGIFTAIVRFLLSWFPITLHLTDINGTIGYLEFLRIPGISAVFFSCIALAAWKYRRYQAG